MPTLTKIVKPGGVYLGVGPDQNFTYIAALEPHIAFITDIRRGNLQQHLMYKALFELSADRAEFLSRLFSRKRPAGLDAASTAEELFDAYGKVEPNRALYDENLQAIRDVLVKKHGFKLTADDLSGIEYVFQNFFGAGPGLAYAQGSFPGRGMMRYPTYADLQVATDGTGQNRAYLGSEASFRALKTFEERNLLVPIVGNFAGPKALRAVGAYLKAHEASVSVFYLSNVEQYLFGDGIWADFVHNVEALPLDESSTFVRSCFNGCSSSYALAGGHAARFDAGAAEGLPRRQDSRVFRRALALPLALRFSHGRLVPAPAAPRAEAVAAGAAARAHREPGRRAAHARAARRRAGRIAPGAAHRPGVLDAQHGDCPSRTGSSDRRISSRTSTRSSTWCRRSSSRRSRAACTSGVAPDQNFTYMLATRPAIAFIVDIRRGNLLEHLMYKALIELSADRAEFLSRLFARKRPANVGPKSSVADLFRAFDQHLDDRGAVPAEPQATSRTQLTKRHGFALSAEDLQQLEGIYFSFFWDGPNIRYSSFPAGVGSRGSSAAAADLAATFPATRS